MPDDLLKTQLHGVTVRGRVKNALSFMRDRQVMVVPLFSAGGMRVKIIEGMALGKPVISTPVGAEGIEYTEGLNILIARNAMEFADHMIALDEAPSYMQMLGTEARKLIEERYSDAHIVKDLTALYNRLRSA
jgi:glycosyltransferase involved in cell wall biosynthesis